MRTALLLPLTVLLAAQPGLAAEPTTPAKPAAAKPGAKPAAGLTIEMTANEDGFIPNRIHVKKGQPLTLVITRTTEQTCATELVVKDYGINLPLPLNKPVTVTFTPVKAGIVKYACAMDMSTGMLLVQ
ncbi:MAG: cupredoxin domain-containing protein [Anaeromyxobacter sp.]|nr:cupredoxin domain-containing protein [Anaeromyxobacter sp.]